MSKALVLGSVLGSPVDASMPYRLESSYQPAPAVSATLSVRTEAELEDMQRAVARSNALFGVGLTTSLVGGTMVAAGAAIIVVGIIPVIFTGDSTIFMVGITTIAAGSALTVIGLPIALTGAMLGSAALRSYGVPVTSAPGWVALSGLGLLVTGAALDFTPASSAGIAMFLGGGLAQVIVTNRAMKQVESATSLLLHPMPVLDGYGLGLTLRR